MDCLVLRPCGRCYFRFEVERMVEMIFIVFVCAFLAGVLTGINIVRRNVKLLKRMLEE